MDEFHWWYIPIFIILWIFGAWLNEYVRRNKYK